MHKFSSFLDDSVFSALVLQSYVTEIVELARKRCAKWIKK